MRAMTPMLLGALAGAWLAAGCSPTVEQADAQVHELSDANYHAESAALAREARRRGVRLGARRPVAFMADERSLDACSEPDGAARSFRLESPELKLVVTVPCAGARSARLWQGTLPDGSQVVLVRGTYSFAVQGQRVLVFNTVPRTTRRERVVYPGSCNEMPSPPRFGPDFSLVVFRGHKQSDFSFVSVPYDAVNVDRTCEHPVE